MNTIQYLRRVNNNKKFAFILRNAPGMVSVWNLTGDYDLMLWSLEMIALDDTVACTQIYLCLSALFTDKSIKSDVDRVRILCLKYINGLDAEDYINLRTVLDKDDPFLTFGTQLRIPRFRKIIACYEFLTGVALSKHDLLNVIPSWGSWVDKYPSKLDKLKEGM